MYASFDSGLIIATQESCTDESDTRGYVTYLARQVHNMVIQYTLVSDLSFMSLIMRSHKTSSC